MKKKILSLVMGLCLAVLLLPTAAFSAKADGDTVAFYMAPYIMNKGDNVADICSLYGVDFKANEKLIRTINGITNYTKIPVGSAIFIPVTAKPSSGAYYEIIKHTVVAGDTMYKICKNCGVNYSSVTELLKALNNVTNLNRICKGQELLIPVFHGTGSTVPGSGSESDPGSGSSGSIPADGVAYYMVSHTMIKGETINELCKLNGMNFKSYEAVIKAVNNISDCSRVYAGSTVYIPSAVKPSGGNYYTIMYHVVSSGDTVYKFCKSLGVDYGKNLALLKVLNNTSNLGRIVVGQTIFAPVFNGTSIGPGTGTDPGTEPADPDAISIKMTLPAATKIADAKSTAAKNGDATIFYLTYTHSGDKLSFKKTTATPTDTEYFMVVAHKVVSGDTVYKLCKAYGIDYARSLDLLRNINSKLNLNMIYKGDYIYLPIHVTTK